MTPSELLSHYHSQAAAAAAINENRQTVHNWFKAGKLPLEAQVSWEVESGGAVRADLPPEVRREEVRA